MYTYVEFREALHKTLLRVPHVERMLRQGIDFYLAMQERNKARRDLARPDISVTKSKREPRIIFAGIKVQGFSLMKIEKCIGSVSKLRYLPQ